MSTALSGQGWNDTVEKQLELFLSENNRTDRPGFAAGILYRGELVYSKGIGMANLETNTVFLPETVSDMGSVAKQMTCFAILLLEQEGKLSLNDDIRKHLPEIPDFGVPITIRHLMHHTSGLREIYAMLALSGWQQGDGIRQEDAMALVKNSRELNFPPGERYSYCNTGYMLLGDLITRLGGMDFEAWMRKHVFAPLGMDNTYIMDIQGEIFPVCAESYAQGRQGTWVKLYDNSTGYGQGGVYSTIPDMAKWLANLRSGNVGGKALIDKMLERGILNNGDTLSYALGLEHAVYKGVRLIQHTGSSAGYRTILAYAPGQDYGIILKSNYAGFDATATCRSILDILLGLPPAAAEMEKTPEPDQVLNLSPEVLKSYAGKYFSPELEVFYEISLVGNTLQLSHRKLGTSLLRAVATDRFAGSSGVGQVEFERDKKQRITGMRVSSGGAMRVRMQKME